MRKMKLFIPFGIAWLTMLAMGCGGKGNGALNGDYTRFKIADTAGIDSMVFQDKGGQTVRLQRHQGYWMADGAFMARPDLINITLNTLHRMEVKEFVKKTARENLLTQLAVYSTHVLVYDNGEPVADFHVGGPTPDHMGTYMLKSGADVPVIVYVPGFRGYLYNHFSPLIEEWKDRKIFQYALEDIRAVRVEDLRDAAQSFELTVLQKNQFQVKRLQDGSILPQLDTGLVKIFLKNFKLLGFESFVDINAARLDSVKRNYPLHRITVFETSGKFKELALYAIPLPPGTLNMIGDPVSVDVDRMYGIIDGKIQTICQYYTFDPVTVPVRWFIPGMAATVPPGPSGSRFHD